MLILIDISSQKTALADEIKRIKKIPCKDDSARVSRTGYFFCFQITHGVHYFMYLYLPTTYLYSELYRYIIYTAYDGVSADRLRGRYIFYYYCIFL